MILQSADWPFLRGSNPLVVQTVTDYSTGTVATTAGSTTITFNAVVANSVQGYFIQTSSSTDWYRITSHTAGTASATLEIAAIYTAAAATFTVRKFFYATSSVVDRILGIRQSVIPFQLEERTNEQFNVMNPNMSQVGTPLIFMMVGKDSSDVWQFRLWPSPDTVINLYIDYLQTVSDLSADSDVSIIPAKWHTNVLLEGAKWQGYNFLDDTRSDAAKQAFMQMIADMKQHELPSTSLHRVLKSVEYSQPVANEFPLPQFYPNV